MARTLERRIRALKTDEFYWSRMRWWDQQFKDPTYLATLTLGQFGSLIEYSAHNDLHMRWSAPPRDPVTNTLLLPAGRPDADTGPRWDNPRYDWLGDFYSSHVNPFFWRLHGWIDDRVSDWFDAHEALHPGQIEKVRISDFVWFKKGMWVEVDHPWVWPDELAGGGGHMHALHDAGHDPAANDHAGHDHGGHGSDPDLHEKRIKSLEAVLDVLNDRKPKTEATVRAAAKADPKPAAEKKPARRRKTSIFGE